MKLVIVVAPLSLQEVGDGQVDLTVPRATLEDIQSLEARLEAIREDDRDDVVGIFFLPGAPRGEIIRLDKVRGVAASYE